MENEECNLEWICDTLLKTYNTSILDRSEQFFKEACVEEAKNCLDKNENFHFPGQKRRVLSQLILNHSNESNPELPAENKKPIANYIGGPIDLTMQWNKESKKLIYIFGEIHDENTDCDKFKIKDRFYGKQHTMLIEDYLEQLIRNTDVFIDFYLEIGRMPGNNSKDRIGKIAERFKYCFYEPGNVDHDMPSEDYDVPDKYNMGFHTNIKCWLSRMHYFDLRQSARDVYPDDISYVCVTMASLFYELQRIEKDMDKDDTSYYLRVYPNIIDRFLRTFNYEEKIKPILERFSEIETQDEYNDFWNKQIVSHRFLSKKVIKSTIHTKIKDFIIKEILNTESGGSIINSENLVRLVKEYMETIDKYRDNINKRYDFTRATKSDIKLIAKADFINHLIAINTYIPDYYLLCRIFKEFNVTPPLQAKSFRWTDEPKEPHNIIIYAGRKHSEKVRKFLKEELDFKMIHNTNMYNKPLVRNCIFMNDFPQPFFSNHRKVRWDDSDDSQYEKSMIISK